MIAKQQKYIEENDIGGDLAHSDKNIEMFLEGAELDNDDQENQDQQEDGGEGQYG